LLLEVVLELAGRGVDDALDILLRLGEVQRHQCHDTLPGRRGVLRVLRLQLLGLAVVHDHVATGRQQCHRAEDDYRGGNPFPRRAGQATPRRFRVRFRRLVITRCAGVDLADARVAARLYSLGLDFLRVRLDALGGELEVHGVRLDSVARVLHVGGLLSLPAKSERARTRTGGRSSRLGLCGLGLRFLGKRSGLAGIRRRIRWRFVDAVGVGHRFTAPERPHTDLLCLNWCKYACARNTSLRMSFFT